MSDTPKRWLIEVDHKIFIEEGYGDALEAVRGWALRTLSRPDCVRVSEINNPHKVDVRLVAHSEYR